MGPQGPQGLQGPSATSFAKTLEEGADTTLATASNGVTVVGKCAGGVGLELKTAEPGTHLQASGILAQDALVQRFDTNNKSANMSLNASEVADLGLLARDSTIGRFARFDLHAEHGTPCTFWGMITPSA